MPRIIDVTLPVRPGMLTYPGDPVVSIERTSDMRNGDVSNLSIVSMSTHTGTHVDPPIHFVDGGATIDAMSLETLVGEAVVVDVRGVGTIGAGELEALELPADVERLLFLTDWWERTSSRSRPRTTPRSRFTARCSARTSRSWRGWICETCRRAGTRSGASGSRSMTATEDLRGSS
jgi:kynurenine formamidase